jgi:hypothetical protein
MYEFSDSDDPLKTVKEEGYSVPAAEKQFMFRRRRWRDAGKQTRSTTGVPAHH